MQNEDYAIYQIDTVLTAKKWLESNSVHGVDSVKKHGHDQGIGSRQISDFLGEKNWSKSKVAELLKIQRDLHPDLLDKIKNAPNMICAGIKNISIIFAKKALIHFPHEIQGFKHKTVYLLFTLWCRGHGACA